MNLIGKSVESDIFGKGTIVDVIEVTTIGVHFDQSSFPKDSVDCWYEYEDGRYVAGHGHNIINVIGD